jgi:hypothetical protein
MISRAFSRYGGEEFNNADRGDDARGGYARGGSHAGKDILEGELSALFTAEKSASSKY